jgi:transcriptional regulator with XRE-family HTH domain
MDVRQRLGLNVQRLRRAKGWSQEEFADRAGLHRTYVSGVERGIRNPTVTIVEKLATALESSIAELTQAARQD